ncbi:MAG: hypothetical protein IJ776_09430 [Paludibacteraceae bacterium]|nr:hypothetical protein [Paludibacteraceae bacterium]
MFVGEPTIKEYRDIRLENVLKEYLYFKGTFDSDDTTKQINKEVCPKFLCRSALWLYGLKDNPTNRMSVIYYCERQARQNLWYKHDIIVIPDEIWRECDEYNRKMCKK